MACFCYCIFGRFCGPPPQSLVTDRPFRLLKFFEPFSLKISGANPSPAFWGLRKRHPPAISRCRFLRQVVFRPYVSSIHVAQVTTRTCLLMLVTTVVPS